MSQAKMAQMRKEEKNIPFTRAEIKALPYGFTETAILPTRNFDSKVSKFIPPPKPKFKKHGTEK